ncbi:hypothetical protein [Paenibacillus hemerocallicola]|uniref:hypothetical protein n=1 Tax=Paenibacillus hemerocallicola TaxID=1172614 RepID=UPI00159ED9EF|nr:hypothetical protein [Paenibacillus hemerocallicola]
MDHFFINQRKAFHPIQFELKDRLLLYGVFDILSQMLDTTASRGKQLFHLP